jgi:ribonucleoside-triphosphate reductase (thioredoxin)
MLSKRPVTPLLSSEDHSRFKFSLPKEFVEEYAMKEAPFGFNKLGYFVYKRTYSRVRPEDGKNEEWYQTVERCVNGAYTMLREAAAKNPDSIWLEEKALRSAKIMYDKIFNMKFLPPGRGLWAMGSPITEHLRLFASLNNCGFVSTEDLYKEEFHRAKPFVFVAEMSMKGVGMGFDTKGAGGFIIKGPTKSIKAKSDLTIVEKENVDIITKEIKKEEFSFEGVLHTIEDSREGWVDSIDTLLSSYFDEEGGKLPVEFDYSKIREKGKPLKTFGGIAPGPQPLIDLHNKLREILDKQIGKYISVTIIVDIMNLIGACVVAGGVRRTAEIAFGSPYDEEFLELKNPDLPRMQYPGGWGYTSNNSVIMNAEDISHPKDLMEITKRMVVNGEPGIWFQDNARNFGRMNRKNKEDHIKEPKAMGTNPCGEQTLESYELCNLVEVFLSAHDSLEELEETIKYAYLWGKIVTTGLTNWEETNEVIERNRRIGVSFTGIAQFIDKFGRKRVSDIVSTNPKDWKFFKNIKLEDLVQKEGMKELKIWCKAAKKRIDEWDITYSKWLNIPTSIKRTSIKPSGTVSLLQGATPGMHYPLYNYYKRRVRIPDTNPLLDVLSEANYEIEDDLYARNTKVVSFPVFCGSDYIPCEHDISLDHQFNLMGILQKHWSDNQVSVTIKFWQTPTMRELIYYLPIILRSYKIENILKFITYRNEDAWFGFEEQEIFSHISVLLNDLCHEDVKSKYEKQCGVFLLQDNNDLSREYATTLVTKFQDKEFKESIRNQESILKTKTILPLMDKLKKTTCMRYGSDDDDDDEMNATEKTKAELDTEISNIQKEIGQAVEGLLKDCERRNVARVNSILHLIKAMELAHYIYLYKDKIKSLSMLPINDGVYEQAPYQRISKEEYKERSSLLKEIKSWGKMPQPEAPIGCDGDSCTL